LLDAVDDRLDRVRGQRALLRGHAQSVQQLLALELLATAVLLHDHHDDSLHLLVRGESFVAGLALTAAADAALRGARVDYASGHLAAVRALHAVFETFGLWEGAGGWRWGERQ